MPAGLSFFLILFFVSESPKFLVLQGDYDRVLVFLRSLVDRASENKVKAERFLRTIEAFKAESSSAGKPTDRSDDKHKSASSKKIFRVVIAKICSAPLRRNVLLISSIFFTLSYASYGLMGWFTQLFIILGFDENPYLPSIFLAYSSGVSNIGALYAITVLGAKRVLIFALIGASFSLVMLGILQHHKISSAIAAGCFQCFCSAGWNALGPVSSERFPDQIRSFGLGLTASIGRLGGISANLVNGVLFNSVEVRVIVILNAIVLVVGSYSAWLV